MRFKEHLVLLIMMSPRKTPLFFRGDLISGGSVKFLNRHNEEKYKVRYCGNRELDVPPYKGGEIPGTDPINSEHAILIRVHDVPGDNPITGQHPVVFRRARIRHDLELVENDMLFTIRRYTDSKECRFAVSRALLREAYKFASIRFINRTTEIVYVHVNPSNIVIGNRDPITIPNDDPCGVTIEVKIPQQGDISFSATTSGSDIGSERTISSTNSAPGMSSVSDDRIDGPLISQEYNIVPNILDKLIIGYRDRNDKEEKRLQILRSILRRALSPSGQSGGTDQADLVLLP